MGRQRPVIGITAAHYSEELKSFPRAFYVDSIRNAGGTPIILPPVQNSEESREVLDLIDGLLLTGGGDISPTYLKEDPQRGVEACFPERDFSELLLAKGAMQLDLPLLGICRGIQVLAVAAGGKIYQDIPTQYPEAIEHKQTAPRQYTWHSIEVKQTSLLFTLLKKTGIDVNSLHHQAVREIPSGFQINAQAVDGIIEGIEKTAAKFCLGVQWHPESLLETEKHSRALFSGFIEACIDK
ncbi:gamma-glutamyl-gamma-aminobutyrate hydrolase family protein [Desulfosporosinus sp. FKA]|uniref:gamma-glutamyl-gamma-aminobutyrate hydrolase family protein n=1 Tax=Desulfosporosinus sp. FKA TaxID=1969834 RepID=UPI000B49DD1E|nr:gamma-glutamyl-gamma-aminobutyrate hydrolase family protein [Desulfosporosinus sp. FKA]